MNDHTLRVLEYDKLREIVSRFAASEPGRLSASGLLPSVEAEEVARLQDETREFLRLLHRGESPPLDGIRDIAPQLEKLRVSGIALTPLELLEVTSTLAAGRKVRGFFRHQGEESPRLAATAGRITPLKDIEEAVLAAIDDAGEVRDSASPALRRIRKQLGRTRGEILDQLSRILRGGADGNIVQEQVITLRDDRYVIPLKPNFRHSIKGVVHGQSGSRATLFVEPLAVLEQNNRLAELRMEEREEIERLLRELTLLCAGKAGEIEETFRALAALDAIYARARFGETFHGAVAAVSPDGRIRLRGARHPLLVARREGSGDVTPNDLDLGGDERALIVSGPNAGGKTVMLKTAGLLCLLSQAGIPVTAAEGSELPVFGAVYADIGDEQSLEQDLSTFSSHVRQIAGILRNAKRDSLVLLDELGAGTDPAEGSALGAAVLAKLLDLGCTTIVTTHHGVLKLFGAKTSGAVNAAMEFDPATLRPTYRFVPGRPGRSYGLDMAARLGVAADVIQDAASRLGETQAGLDRLLERLESDSRALGFARDEAEKELDEATARKKEAEALLHAARDEARAVKTKAKEEARDVLHALRQKLKELSRAAALRPASEVANERAAVEALARQLEPEPFVPVPSAPAGYEFRAGERVRMPRLKKTGVVLASKKGTLEVDAGGITLKVAANEAVPVQPVEPVRTTVSSGWSAELSESSGMPDRLNLLGFRVDEALAEVERLLGRAAIENRSTVTIIHGLGTGALKSAVTEFLKQHPLVATFRTGEPSEGGPGVTVAELKK